MGKIKVKKQTSLNKFFPGVNTAGCSNTAGTSAGQGRVLPIKSERSDNNQMGTNVRKPIKQVLHELMFFSFFFVY